MKYGQSAMPMRLPFFYGWVVVSVSFVTMAVAVNARTAFSLLYSPILDEFGWERGVTAGAFAIGFFVATGATPLFGMMMDRWGPRVVIPVAALSAVVGFVLTTWIQTPLGLFMSFGLFVIAGSVGMSYIGHSMFLPNWFVSKRGLAVGIAFSGVGAGSITLLPLAQVIIESYGWRAACLALAGAVAVVVIPLNMIFQRRQPSDIGLEPDGGGRREKDGSVSAPVDNIVDSVWANTEWTLGKAFRTGRFWWLCSGYFCGLFAWYSVLVHQTRYLTDIGFGATEAAFALGLVGAFGVAGQIGLGALSDRIGREWAWSISCVGFVLCYLALIMLADGPSRFGLYVMVMAQGGLGYGLASMFGAIPAELFAGRRFATIFSVTAASANVGAGVGPWFTGAIFDATGSYYHAFVLSLVLSVVSAGCIWMAAPRKVRLVAGQAARREALLHSASSGTLRR